MPDGWRRWNVAIAVLLVSKFELSQGIQPLVFTHSLARFCQICEGWAIFAPKIGIIFGEIAA